MVFCARLNMQNLAAALLNVYYATTRFTHVVISPFGRDHRLRITFSACVELLSKLFGKQKSVIRYISSKLPILAGALGLEPRAYGFGDRRSTN